MAEQTPQPQPVAGAEGGNGEPNLKSLQEQLAAIKAAQSGSDRKVAELSEALTRAEQEKQALLKEKMSERERAQFELEQREKALAAKEAELKANRLALDAASVITEYSVPKELAPFIKGASREEMAAQAKALMDNIRTAAQRDVNERLVRQGGPAPVTGGQATPSGLTREQLDDPAFVRAKLASLPPGPEKEKMIQAIYAAATQKN